MLKSQRIINTWKCDDCLVEIETLINPFYNITITAQSEINATSSNLDLCEECIKKIANSPIISYTEDAP